MTVNEYQNEAHKYAVYNTCDESHMYPILGLTEEAGEVAGKFAKIVRDKKGVISKEDALAIVKELGDVCWMIAEVANNLGVTLEQVMQGNLDKLASRKERNVINGNGDDR